MRACRSVFTFAEIKGMAEGLGLVGTCDYIVVHEWGVCYNELPLYVVKHITCTYSLIAPFLQFKNCPQLFWSFFFAKPFLSFAIMS